MRHTFHHAEPNGTLPGGDRGTAERRLGSKWFLHDTCPDRAAAIRRLGGGGQPLQALGGPGVFAHGLVGGHTVELLVEPQQVHLAEVGVSQNAVLQLGQLVQVGGLVGHGHLLLPHLPVGDDLLHVHHQLRAGRDERREEGMKEELRLFVVRLCGECIKK